MTTARTSAAAGAPACGAAPRRPRRLAGARAPALARERGGEGRHLLVQRALEFRGRAARGELVRERRGDAHQADGERVQIQREVAGEGDVAA